MGEGSHFVVCWVFGERKGEVEGPQASGFVFNSKVGGGGNGRLNYSKQQTETERDRWEKRLHILHQAALHRVVPGGLILWWSHVVSTKWYWLGFAVLIIVGWCLSTEWFFSGLVEVEFCWLVYFHWVVLDWHGCVLDFVEGICHQGYLLQWG